MRREGCPSGGAISRAEHEAAAVAARVCCSLSLTNRFFLASAQLGTRHSLYFFLPPSHWFVCEDKPTTQASRDAAFTAGLRRLTALVVAWPLFVFRFGRRFILLRKIRRETCPLLTIAGSVSFKRRKKTSERTCRTLLEMKPASTQSEATCFPMRWPKDRSLQRDWLKFAEYRLFCCEGVLL